MKNTARLLACALALAAAACSNAPARKAGTPLERGLQALEQGRARTARIEFMEAIEESPADPRLRLLQARTYLMLGDGLAAEFEILRARSAGARAGSTGHLLAHALLLQGQPHRALEEAATADPAHEAYSARMRGRAFMAVGDDRAAAAELERALAAAALDPALWTDIARFRRRLGELAAAIEAADRAVSLRPREVEALTLRGELTRSQYGLQAALPWFDRALEIDPNNVTALLERAATAGDLGRMHAMLADTRRVLSITGGHPVAYYLQAMLAARARDFTLAGSLYARTRGALDSLPAAMLLASAIDYQTGNAAAAAGRLHRLVERQPGNRKARRLLGAVHWRLGDPAATVEALRPIADLPDADSYTLTLLGRALEAQGDGAAAAHYLARAASPWNAALAALDASRFDDAAFAELRAAADHRPVDAAIQIRYASALLARGLADEALARARRLRAAYPGVPEAHMLVGDALGIGGNFAAAAEEYRRAANLAFNEPVALRLIEALDRSGEAAAATAVLQLFLQQNPRNVPALLLSAGRHMEAGNWGPAILIYEDLRRRLGSRDATLLNNLAWAYAEQGEFERAVPLARRAWALDRGNPATADTLGWILFSSGAARTEGLALLERAARGAPTDADIRRHLDLARRARS